MHSPRSHAFLLTLALPLLLPAFVSAQTPDETAAENFWSRFEVGPARGALGDIAGIDYDETLMFGGPEEAEELLLSWQNPASGEELGVLTPISDDDWYVFFHFEPIGYVKDDEKDDLDADELLKTMRKGVEAGNRERERLGFPVIALDGWVVPPRYDAITQNLEWGTLISSQTGHSVNYNVRLLGRRGVMNVELLCSPEMLDTYLPAFRRAIDGFSFEPGNQYAEFREGDKVAQYGLTALVAGGAVAGLAKAGLLKKLLKPLLLAGAVLIAFLRRLFTRRRPAEA